MPPPPAPLLHFPLEPGNPQRADTQALKARLQELLPGPEGREYWKAFGELLTGQITRAEFDLVVEPIFAAKTEEQEQEEGQDHASAVHNLLVLAVLFNISQPAGVYRTPPKPKRGEGGWFNGSKRKRGWFGAEGEDQLDESPEERQRQRVKEAVMALGKRERQRLKQLPELLSNPTPSFLQSAQQQAQQTHHQQQQSSHSPFSAAGAATLKPVDAQELARWESLLTCRQEEDIPSNPALLADRMSAMAHRTGLHSAAPEAGSLMLDAVQLLQSGILRAIVKYQKTHHGGKLTLNDMDNLFQLHPDLVAPPSHPLSSIVETTLTAAKQRKQLSRLLRSKPLIMPSSASSATAAASNAQRQSPTKIKAEPKDQHANLAESLFPETKPGPAREWDVVDTKSLFADLLV